jgi:hypothetical protein
MPRLRRPFLAIAAVTAALTLSVQAIPASAESAPPTRAELLTRANHLMFDITLTHFINIKTSARSALDSTFEWHDNGCTAPWRAITGVFSDFFDRSCQRHDFGYRNFGHGLALGSPAYKAEQKAQVDAQLLADMRQQCSDSPGLPDCNTAAYAFYLGVTRSGQAQTAFFARECPENWLCLFDDTGYGDRRIALQTSENDMNDVNFGDKTSSTVNNTAHAWVLYDDHDYGDTRFCVAAGYVVDDWHDYGFNDKISSARPLSTAYCPS